MCRIFNEIIANSPLLQYKMELEIAGLVDRSSIELPVTAKLSHLKAYQEAFKSTQKTLWRTSFNKGFSLVYSGDVGFVLSHTSIPEDLRDHPLLYDTIDVCHVPPASFSHDTPCCCEWWTIHATCPFTSISADPSQDLVILYDADIVSGGPDGTPLVSVLYPSNN